MGRVGLLKPYMRPIYPAPGQRHGGDRAAAPGDNWMLHVGPSRSSPATSSSPPSRPSAATAAGDLLATSFQARGARASSSTLACATSKTLRRWASRSGASASAAGLHQGHHRLGQHPVVCAGMLVTPGDAIVADDDGVVCDASARVPEVLAAATNASPSEGEARQTRVRRAWGSTCTDARAVGGCGAEVHRRP